jgi:primase-polymerase (primpol)-like protein
MLQKPLNAALKIQEPTWLKPIFTNIPSELKNLPWAVWKAEPRFNKDKELTGKWSKAPRNPITGKMVGSDKPELFGTFEEAKKAYKTGGYTGVGVLLIGNGIIGIDIDDGKNILKQKSGLKQWLLDASQKNIYFEISPSGTGLRIFLNGHLSCAGKKRDGLEIYQDERFLTVTGNIALGKGAPHD